MNAKSVRQNTDDNAQSDKRPFCGIIMPIADTAGYDSGHWGRVRTALDEAIKEAGYFPRIVSESNETGVIHGRIVQNLYDDPIVVCDVSGRNPNVMFELGMRLAFDKPTIIIKDQKTDYSFDTSTIEHINYRADLRFDDVRDLQERLTAAIGANVEKKRADPDYSPFLKHFHRVKVTELQTEEVGSQQFIIEQLQSLKTEIAKLSKKASGDTAESVIKRILSSENYNFSDPDDIVRASDKITEELHARDLNLPEKAMRLILQNAISHIMTKKSGEQAGLF
jgi:hypothetical protein